MILTHRTDLACPDCNSIGYFGWLGVNSSSLRQGCKQCGYLGNLPLPPIKKSIIYLDQFFYSHAFRNSLELFVNARNRVKHCASKQLVVSPWSSIHELETHLWDHSEQKNLWKFIKNTARGHQFTHESDVEYKQHERALIQFADGIEPSVILEQSDVLQNDVHTWDDYYWVDITGQRREPKKLKERERAVVEQLVGTFDIWSESDNEFEDDVQAEYRGYSNALVESFCSYVEGVQQGDLEKTLYLSDGAELMQRLYMIDYSTLSSDERIERLLAYLTSKHFKTVPSLKLSCALFALLRGKVRFGQYSNRVKAVKKLSGVYRDFAAISTYAPYCDAIFIDREMHRWISESDRVDIRQYGTRIFSTENMPDFLQYLDGLEAGMDQHTSDMVDYVYRRSEK